MKQTNKPLVWSEREGGAGHGAGGGARAAGGGQAAGGLRAGGPQQLRGHLQPARGKHAEGHRPLQGTAGRRAEKVSWLTSSEIPLSVTTLPPTLVARHSQSHILYAAILSAEDKRETNTILLFNQTFCSKTFTAITSDNDV